MSDDHGALASTGSLGLVHLFSVYLLCVGAGVQAGHQVEDVAEGHWVQVFNE